MIIIIPNNLYIFIGSAKYWVIYGMQVKYISLLRFKHNFNLLILADFLIIDDYIN